MNYRYFSLCFFILILLFPERTFSQMDIGRVQVQIRAAKEDTGKVALYRKVVESYTKRLPDTAYRYAEEGLKLSDRLQDVAGQA
jgi:hypothetical protein